LHDLTEPSHADRCQEQDHAWENCCSIWFEIYQRCKWCGEKRSLR